MREPRMNIRMEKALDALDDERMEPCGFWAFDPDFEIDREVSREAGEMLNQWILGAYVATSGGARIRVSGE